MSESATQLLTVEETAARLKIGRSRAYELISSQRLPGSMRIGRSLRVSARHLEEWIDKQARETDLAGADRRPDDSEARDLL